MALKFLDTTKEPCASGDGNNLNALKAVWSGLSTSYSALSSDVKTFVKAADAIESDKGYLESSMARYEHIVNKYTSLNDFIGRVSATGSNIQNKVKTNNAFLIISIISIISLSAIVSLAICKKSKARA